jgi:hypothetical protein
MKNETTSNDDKVKSIEHALSVAQVQYEAWGSKNLGVLRDWQILNIKEYFVSELIKALRLYENDKNAFLDLILKINKE